MVAGLHGEEGELSDGVGACDDDCAGVGGVEVDVFVDVVAKEVGQAQN